MFRRLVKPTFPQNMHKRLLSCNKNEKDEKIDNNSFMNWFPAILLYIVFGKTPGQDRREIEMKVAMDEMDDY